MKNQSIKVSELTRTCNEMILLTMLLKEPLHGYQIAVQSREASKGLIEFKHGTLYPILHSLEKRKLLEGVWHGKKKAYCLTDKGKIYANNQKRHLLNFLHLFRDILEGSIHE